MTYDDVIMNRLKQDGIYECVVEMFKAKQGEIERLREALRDINMLNNANDHSDSPRLHIGGIRMIIRAALGEKESLKEKTDV